MTTKNTGKGKHGTRQSIMVDTLDTEKVTQILRDILAAQYGGTADDYAVAADTLVIAPIPNTDDGWDRPRHALICTEGVGWEQDEYQRIYLPGYYGMGAPAGTHVGVYRLLDECRTGEQIDLADFIRSFGDRLENNFSIWHRRLTVGGERVIR